MSYNTIYNIAYKNINTNLSVLYAPTGNTFDLLARSVDANLYSINNTIQNYYYDLLWSNNFLEHTQKTADLAYQLHLIDILWFHGTPPANFKKEDIALVRNQLQKSIRVFSDAETAQSWGYDSHTSTIIPYGIPVIEDLENIEKTESVLVMNPGGSSDIQNLYNHIKTAIPNTATIDDLQNIHSVTDLYSIMSKYKVIIDIYNPLNVLISQYLGCKSVTATNPNTNMKGVTRLFDYGNITAVLESLIQDVLSAEDILSNQRWIKSNHSFEQFNYGTSQLLYRIKHEEFFIA